MTFHYESRDILNMRAQLVRLHGVPVIPGVFYDAGIANFMRDPNCDSLDIRATEIAELTIQKGGSVYDNKTSNSVDPIRKIVMYIGGFNAHNDILVIGQSVETETGNLTVPAKLSLQDLIGYRTIEKISR